LTLLVSQAPASIEFESDFVATSGTACSISCMGIPTSLLPTFQETFTLTPVQLSTDGSYDVSGTLSPSLLAQLPSPPFTNVFSADAVVSGGTVTDLQISLSSQGTVSSILGNIFKTETLNSSGGSWTENIAASGAISTSAMYSGYYTIQAVPEPSAWTLLIAGLCPIMVVLRKRAQGRLRHRS
jgi:hypothetical protein